MCLLWSVEFYGSGGRATTYIDVQMVSKSSTSDADCGFFRGFALPRAPQTRNSGVLPGTRDAPPPAVPVDVFWSEAMILKSLRLFVILAVTSLIAGSAFAQIPTVAEINRLPVRSRAEGAPLVADMKTIPYEFVKRRALLPAKFRILDETRLQQTVDFVVTKLLETEAGRVGLCPFSQAREAQAYLGVSAPAVARIAERCKSVKASPVKLHAVRNMAARMLPGDPPVHPAKRYVFIVSDEAKTPIQSYTSKDNVTYFVFMRGELSAPTVIRAFAHELAISYDPLQRLAYLIDPTTWQQGLNLIYGRGAYEPAQFREFPRQQMASIKCAIRDPVLRYAAASERAFRFEDAIIRELGLEKTSPAVASYGGTCAKAIRRNILLISGIANAIAWETDRYQIYCGRFGATGGSRVSEVLNRLETIAETRITPVKGGKDQSLCELLIAPKVGPMMPDLDGGGPRPRMGGSEGELKPSDGDDDFGTGSRLDKWNRIFSFPDTDRVFDMERRR